MCVRAPRVCVRDCVSLRKSGGSSGEALPRCRKSEPMMVIDGEKGTLQQGPCQTNWGLAKDSGEGGQIKKRESGIEAGKHKEMEGNQTKPSGSL